METQTGTVKALARRAEKSDPMEEINEAVLEAGGGVAGESRSPGKRAVTLLAVEAWNKACAEVQSELPWWIRRANILIDGIDLQQALNKEIHIGETIMQVHGETRPCQLMDDQHEGLRAALKPDMRGGVFAEVIKGGTIRPGDQARLILS
ncbi:MAG: MOSC domain-containing protein [Phycisphaerae bacterium]